MLVQSRISTWEKRWISKDPWSRWWKIWCSTFPSQWSQFLQDDEGPTCALQIPEMLPCPGSQIGRGKQRGQSSWWKRLRANPKCQYIHLDSESTRPPTMKIQRQPRKPRRPLIRPMPLASYTKRLVIFKLHDKATYQTSECRSHSSKAVKYNKATV